MILITDEATQIELTGQTSQEIIASLHRKADSAHRPAEQQNYEALQLEVQAHQAIKMALYRETVKFTDEAYRVTFLQKAEILKVVRNEDGDIVRDEYGNPRTAALTDEEKLALVPGSNGKINVFTNGIFNSGEAAAFYSMQMSEIPPGDHVYLVYYPEASNALSELMVAGFQYFLEGGISDLSNAALEIINLAERYGGDGLHLIGHSRGAMTIGNALEVLARSPETAGMLEHTMVKFLGPAYSAEKAATLLYGLSGGTQTSVQLQNHADDFVGTIIGGNPATYDQRPEHSSKAREWLRILGDAPTVHGCYGSGAADPEGCQARYGNSVTTNVPSIR